MELALPTPNIENLRAIRNDRDAIKAALDLKSTLARIVRALDTQTIAAMAQQRATGCSLVESLRALSVVAASYESEVELFNALARAVRAGEAEKLKPILDMARPRLFEVMQKLADFPNRIALTKCGRVTSIKKLVDAGASREDAERIASEKQGETVAELEAERDAMIKEKAALQRFLKTKDPADIPPGFSL